MKKPAYLFSLLLSIVLASACSSEPLGYTNINNDELKALLDQGVKIYDIRRPEEWKQTGIVSGSETLTFVSAGGRLMPDFVPTFTKDVQTDQPVILICRTGNRTGVLSDLLVKQLGYTNVYNVKHGITRWIKDGHSVEKAV